MSINWMLYHSRSRTYFLRPIKVVSNGPYKKPFWLYLKYTFVEPDLCLDCNQFRFVTARYSKYSRDSQFCLVEKRSHLREPGVSEIPTAVGFFVLELAAFSLINENCSCTLLPNRPKGTLYFIPWYWRIFCFVHEKRNLFAKQLIATRNSMPSNLCEVWSSNLTFEWVYVIHHSGRLKHYDALYTMTSAYCALLVSNPI